MKQQQPVTIDGAVITPALAEQIKLLQYDDCEAISIHRQDLIEMLKFVTLDYHGGQAGNESNVLKMARTLVIMMDIIETFNPECQKGGEA